MVSLCLLFGDEPADDGIALVRQDVEDAFHRSKADNGLAIRGECGELGVIDGLKGNRWMPKLPKKRRVALNRDGPSGLGNERQVTLEVISIHQFTGKLSKRQHRGFTQVKSNLHLAPGANTRRNADGLRWSWADARVAGDEKQNARLQARRLVETDKTIGGRDDVADHG